MGLSQDFGGARHFLTRRLRTRCWQLLKRLRKEVTVNTKHGRLTISTRDSGISPAMWVYREIEYGFSIRCLHFLRQEGFLSSGDVNLYDIGANIGFIGIGLLRARLVDYVVAFEPDPENFHLLVRNTRQNDLADRMLNICAALSDVAASLDLERSSVNAGDHRIRTGKSLTEPVQGETGRETIAVPALTLDGFVAQEHGVIGEPSVLWIDVQGHEGFVFRGGAGTLRMNRIAVVSEVWPYGILRAGMSIAEFIEIIGSIWPYYWIERHSRRGRGSRFVRYPVSMLDRYIEELGPDDRDFGNVIFTPSSGPQLQVGDTGKAIS